MEKLYEKSVDLHVRKVFIYAKNADAYAYSDPSYTEKIKNDDLKDRFQKGAIIVSAAGIEYSPISYSSSGVITYVKTNGTTTTTADLATLVSEEYTG